jgi:hypothetical protein
MDTKFTPVSDLRLGDHACIFYANRRAQVSVAALFIMKGLLRGERCFYIADDNPVVHIWNALRALNVNVAEEQRRRSLQFFIKRDTYLKRGRFDPSDMLSLLKRAERSALAAGYRGLCATGELSWAAGQTAAYDPLFQYERNCGAFFGGSKAVGLCQYNRNLFPPAFLKRVASVHGHQLSRRVFQRSASAARPRVAH